jgi:hypothetical protein
MEKKMRKVLIYGRNFHARAAFRKLSSQPSAWEIIGFVEQDISNLPTQYFDIPVINSSQITQIDFDHIVVAGRYSIEMQTAILKSGVPKEKIWKMKRSDYQPACSAMQLRSQQTYALVKDLIFLLRKSDISHWFIASALLALKRNQDLAWFGDVDIAIPYDQLSTLNKLLQANGKFDLVEVRKHAADGPFWKSGGIFQIIIKSVTDTKVSEPAIIDIHALHFQDGNVFYNLSDTKFLSTSDAYFQRHQIFEREELKFNVPIDAEGYLAATYGNEWRTPAEFFNTSDHHGIISW